VLSVFFWKRFNTAGAVAGLAVGLVSSIVLILLSPTVYSAKPRPLFPLENPGVVSIPMGFLAAYLGTILTARDLEAEAKFAELTVRAHTGFGSEKATSQLMFQHLTLLLDQAHNRPLNMAMSRPCWRRRRCRCCGLSIGPTQSISVGYWHDLTAFAPHCPTGLSCGGGQQDRGVVWHDADSTYSLIVPSREPWEATPAGGICCRCLHRLDGRVLESQS